MVFGYSLGELTAVIAAGVFEMQHALKLPLAVAADCVELADNVTMGVLFSRGPVLDFDEVKRLCLHINAEGAGVIGISSFLAPNTVLLLGQYDTVDRFGQLMHDVFPKRVYLRKNSDQWPPVHTPLVWQTKHSQPRGRAGAHAARRIHQARSAGLLAGDRQGQLQRLQRPRDPDAVDRPSAAAVGRGLRNAGLRRRNGDSRRARAQPGAGHVHSACATTCRPSSPATRSTSSACGRWPGPCGGRG